MSTQPTHSCFVVREGAGENSKGFWMEIGAAWSNADGSLTCKLDAVPTGGKLIIRKREPKPASEA